MFMRSCIIVGTVRLKTTGKKSCPKLSEYSLQQSFWKGKKWWWYVNRVDSTLDNINPEVTSPHNDGVFCLRFETKKSLCYSSMGITSSTAVLGFWACQSLDLGSQSSTWRYKNLWPHVMRNTTHVHTCNLCCLAGIAMRVLCNSLLCCCGGFDEDICHKSCW